MATPRKIIHVDMDAFFAAVEQRDFPQYRNKPLIVGGMPDARGVVATCSYEARKFGIHSAMPSSQAYRLCPKAIFVKPRFDVYREESTAIRNIFSEYTDLIEPLSLDEAYLDVTGCGHFQGSATLVAQDIKRKIKSRTDLTASAGISYNKFLAKIASDINKPDGLFIIPPSVGEKFVEDLAIDRFHGIGKATSRKMKELGVTTGRDLKKLSLDFLFQHFGKTGRHYYHICRGIDQRPVINNRISKSVGVETTFQEDIEKATEVLPQLEKLLDKALNRARTKHLTARTLTVKIKYHDFVQITRSRTVNHPIQLNAQTLQLLNDILKQTEIGQRKVRLLGVTLSSLNKANASPPPIQLDVFEPHSTRNSH